MEKDLIVVYVTNKTMKGDEKESKYYASGYIPAGLAARYPGKVLVVDIDDPKNQAFLLGDYSQNLYAFPVDKKYKVSAFRQYQHQAILLDKQMRNRVRMVVPYVSSEADTQILSTMKGGYPDDVFYTNDPETMAEFNSKASLERVRLEGGHFLREHIQPQTVIQTKADFLTYQSMHKNFVLRALRSTEGLGVYFHAPDYHEGQVQVVEGTPSAYQYEIEGLLSQGALLATPYIDTSVAGDTRAFYYWDVGKNEPAVIAQGGKRMAPKISGNNLFPVCNVSSGGTDEIVDLTLEQRQVIQEAGAYYHTLGLNFVGFDLLGIPCGGKIKPILSEGNLSADAWNRVAHQPVSKGQGYLMADDEPLRGDRILVAQMAQLYEQSKSSVHQAQVPARPRSVSRQNAGVSKKSLTSSPKKVILAKKVKER